MNHLAQILIIATFAIFAIGTGVSAQENNTRNCSETELPRYFEDDSFAYEDYEYIISRENLTWKDAYRTCACFNYTALYFESDQEFEYVTNQLEELGYGNEENSFWTGGYALEEPVLKNGQAWLDAFYWLPNAQQIYQRFWSAGEPDNRSRERCVALTNQEEFSLVDDECQLEHRFICKRRSCDCGDGGTEDDTTTTRGTTRRSSTRRTTTELVMILE